MAVPCRQPGPRARQTFPLLRPVARPALVTVALIFSLGSLSFADASETAVTAKGQPPCLMLPVGSVQPRGWMLAQLEADLAGGVTGRYDDFHTSVTQRLFAAQQRVPGTWVPASRFPREKCWWSGEVEGSWYDGMGRSAILAGRQEDIDRMRAWVDDVLARYDETGYIGIYSPETRFPARGFDGELWTQSLAMEALLSWYEFTGDRRVLDAVTDTVRKSVNHYRAKGTYFKRPKSDGGVAHGVAYMHTLEWLWRLTGDDFFADAAVWLFQDYNTDFMVGSVKAGGPYLPDLQVDEMLDLEKPWRDHAPHTAESVHLPGIAGFFSGNERFKQASANLPVKLARHTNPGGGVVAGKLESIAEVSGGGDVAAEYCAKAAAVVALGRLFQYEPKPEFGDWIERCSLNAAQGARFPDGRACIYLSRDNRLGAENPETQGGREIFSAGHRCAACCTVNVPRVLPSYIAGMWYRATDRPALVANLYGPSRLQTKIAGTPVAIEQETDFPFCGKIDFRIDPKSPQAFDLVLRVPPNSGEVSLEAPGADIKREGRTIRLAKTWQPGDKVSVDFDFQMARRLQSDGRQAYYEWGPLVFALPIEPVVTELEEIEKEGKKTGFFDFAVKAADPSPWKTLDDPGSRFAKIDLPDGDPLNPWAQPTVALEGTLKSFEGQPVEVRLLPLGSTLLRRTTFPLTKEAALEANKMHQDSIMRPEDDPMREF